MSPSLRCVVCGATIEEGLAVYANDWERVRGKAPCYGPGCTAQFHPDRHFIPASWPAPAPPDEAARLLEVARQRMRDGARTRRSPGSDRKWFRPPHVSLRRRVDRLPL